MKSGYLKILFVFIYLLIGFNAFIYGTANEKKIEWDQIDLKLSETIDWLYREEYASADSVSQILIDRYPDSPAGYFIRAVISMKKGFYLKNYSDYNDTTKMWLKEAISRSRKQIKTYPRDARAHFFAGGAYGYEGAIYAREKKWIKTGLAALRGIRYLEKALVLDSTLYDIYFGSGLYHVVAGNQTGIVRFIQRLLPIPAGDAKLGYEHLNIAVEKGKFTQLVAIETIAFAHIHYSKQYRKAIDILTSLLEKYPTSLEFYTMRTNSRFYYALNHNQSEWQNLKSDLDTVRAFIKAKELDFYPWWLNKFNFMEGYFHFTEKNYTRAMLLLEDYCEQYPKKNGSYLTALAYLTLGKIYDLQNKRMAAISAYKKVRKFEKMGNEKKLAERFIETPYQGETYRTRFIGAFTDLPNRP